MRSEQNKRMRPERMIRRRRLLLQDINHGTGELAFFQRLQEVGLDEMAAAPAVDEPGAARKRREHARVQNASCLRGKRQQADENVQIGDETHKLLLAGVALDAWKVLRRAAPARPANPNGAEPPEHGRPEHPKPNDADPPLLRRTDTDFAPYLLALLLDIVQEVAMQSERGEGHVV